MSLYDVNSPSLPSSQLSSECVNDIDSLKLWAGLPPCPSLLYLEVFSLPSTFLSEMLIEVFWVETLTLYVSVVCGNIHCGDILGLQPGHYVFSRKQPQVFLVLRNLIKVHLI